MGSMGYFGGLLIYTHIPNLKCLTKIFLLRPKGNLCGGSGGGMTVLNPKCPRLSSGDTISHISSNTCCYDAANIH